MKKKIYIKIFSIFLFLGVLLIGTHLESICAQPNNDRFYEGDYIYGIYYKEHKDGYTYYKTARFLQRSDGQFAYCIQPFVDFINGRLQIAYDSNYAAVTHLSQEQWERILLLAYYGYQYQNHTDSKWYALTQLMIWQTADPASDMYFTDYLNGNRISLYENERAELEQLIFQHNQVPNFQSTNYELSLNQTIVLNDINAVLSQFTILENENVITSISGNTLNVTGKKLGQTEITLTKRDTIYHSVPIVYIDNESQDLLVVGSYDPIVHKVSINVVGGKIRIIKVDSESETTNAQGEASLVGAVYHVFDHNHNLVSTLMIGNDQTATTDFLPYGNYTIEEITSSTGYQVDPTVYSVTIDSNHTFDVTVKESVVKGKIKVTEVDRETNMCKAQGEASLVGAKYGIYNHKNELVETLTIGSDCTATSQFLPYGNYEVRELSASTGYQIDSNHYSVKIEKQETISVISKVNVIKGKIKVTEVDRETNMCKAQGEASLVGAKYGIYNSKNELVETLTIGSDCTATTDFLPYGNYEVRELSASTGYQIDSNHYSVKIEKQETISVISKVNVIKGKIKVTKVDRETNTCKAQGEASLVGAKYGIYNHKNELVETLTIENDCTATTDFLPYGNYEVRELSASIGYQIDSNHYSVKIEKQETISVISKVNVIKGKIKVTKVDSETNTCKAQGEASLVGAKYGIYNSKNELVETLTIGSDCTATTDFLPYGNYEVRELSASTGYYLNDKIYSQFIFDRITYSLIVEEDVIKNEFQFYKFYGNVDTGMIHTEANTQFQILNHKKEVETTIKTDQNGYATVKLPYGKYTVKQVSGIDGYQWISPFAIQVGEETQLVQTFYLKDGTVMARLKLLKIDSETKQSIPVSHIAFKIKDKETDTYICQTTDHVICEFETNEEGILYTPLPLVSGDYLVEEVTAPTGYLLADEPIEFSIQDSSAFIEDPVYGPVLELYFENKPVKGVIQVYEYGEQVVIQDENYIFEQITLSGVKFGLYDVSGNLIEEQLTDENGYIKIENLALGTYILKEFKNREKYMIDDQGYSFTLEYQDPYTPVILKTFTFENYLPRVEVNLLKIDAKTKETIPNTEIKIYTEDDECIYHGITGENGEVHLTDLFPGKFYIVEVKSAKGYQLRKDKLYFDVTENNQLIQIEMENEKIEGELEFMKVEENTNEPLSNTTIEIYTEDGKLVRSGTTDEEGKIRFNGLEYGKYYIVEKEAKEGYTIFEGKIHFEIKEENEVVKLTMEDIKIKGALGFLKVEKDTNKPLRGATVEVYTEYGKLVGSGTTDSEGKILFRNLEYGNYYIIEKEAPVGYTIFEGKLHFEIRENGGVVVVRMEDTKIKGTLEFTKVEEGTDKPLLGATIEIYREDGKLVRSGTTDQNGKILFEDLEYGKYYLIEKEAPVGYTTFEDKLFFEIKEDNEIITITMEDSKIVEVPDTATTRYRNSSYITILFLILGFVSFTYGKI